LAKWFIKIHILKYKYRNCCFNIEAHENMLNPDGLNLLPRILLPLAGPEDFNDEEMEALPEEVIILINHLWKKIKKKKLKKIKKIKIMIFFCYY